MKNLERKRWFCCFLGISLFIVVLVSSSLIRSCILVPKSYMAIFLVGRGLLPTVTGLCKIYSKHYLHQSILLSSLSTISKALPEMAHGDRQNPQFTYFTLKPCSNVATSLHSRMYDDEIRLVLRRTI